MFFSWREHGVETSAHDLTSPLFHSLPVRLGTEPNVFHGPVQLHRNGTWSHVCDAGFDDVTARAVCRELGYEEGRAICCSAYGGAYANPEIDTEVTLQCTGSEGSVEECVRHVPCNSGLYASVVCEKKRGTYNDTGG